MKVFIFLLLGSLSLLANASANTDEHCQQLESSHSSIMLLADITEHQDCSQCVLTHFAINKDLQIFVFVNEALVVSSATRIYTSKLPKVDNPPPINS